MGDIDDLVILPPLPVGVPGLRDCHVGAMAPGLRDLWEDEGSVPGVCASAEAVLPWGTGCNANEMACS